MPVSLLARRAVAVPQIASKKKRSSKRKPPPKKRKPPPKKRTPSGIAKRGKPAPKKRKPAPKKKKKKRTTAQRSAAAKKAWSKRKKKKKLHEAMAEIRMNKSDQPHGWIERRENLRIADDGVWRKISVEYSQKEYDRVRLETLADLEIDFLNRDELSDYLGWMADEINIDLGDAYRFYLGYGQQDQGEA